MEQDYYANLAETKKNHFYANKKISKTNKEYVHRFMNAYDKSPARIALFYGQIHQLLERTPDIKQDMHNRDKINEIFKEIREKGKKGGKMSLPYYATVVNISNRFVKWLNEGEKPKGFGDIQNPPKKSLMRNLAGGDLVTEEDGQKLAGASHSPQMLALVMTQLDGGFRPTELISLNYGDLEDIGDGYYIAHVRIGKTGKRDVPLHRCVPYLMQWMRDGHPTKKAKDPLWMLDYQSESRRKYSQDVPFLRYSIPGIRMRLLRAAKKAGISKHVDLYAMRHSAIRLAKILDNLEDWQAAEKFGHSITFFHEVYGKLSTEDKIKKYKARDGITSGDDIKVKMNVVCSRCRFVNLPGAEVCKSCGSPLSGKGWEKKLSAEKQQYVQTINSMNKMFAQLVAKQESKQRIRKEKVDIIKQLIKEGVITKADVKDALAKMTKH